MCHLLKSYLRVNAGINDGEINDVIKHFKLVTVKKNTILLSRGEVCNNLYFVINGCLRIYYISEQGHVKTRFVAFEGSVATSISSFISQRPTFEFVEALEDSVLYSISHRRFYQLTRQVPAWDAFYKGLLEMAYILQNRKIEELITLSAKQRYDKLMAEKPYYFQRLSNKVLASFLDMTQETLSRVKSK